MGFFDLLVSADKKVTEQGTEQTLELWKKLSRAPHGRVVDFYQQKRNRAFI